MHIAELGKPLILGITPVMGLYQKAKKVNLKFISLRMMCSFEPNTGISELDEFASYFGRSQFHRASVITRTFYIVIKKV